MFPEKESSVWGIDERGHSVGEDNVMRYTNGTKVSREQMASIILGASESGVINNYSDKKRHDPYFVAHNPFDEIRRLQDKHKHKH